MHDDPLRESIRLQGQQRKLAWRRVLWALAASLAVHAGLYLWLGTVTLPPAPPPEPRPIEVEYITLPKPTAPPREPVRATPRKPKPPGPVSAPAPRPEDEVAVAPEAPEPQPDAREPPEPPEPRERVQPRPDPPPPPVYSKTNRDGTFLQYPDGSVTLRNPKLARVVPGARVDDRIRVDERGRIHDGSDSPEATRKRLLAQLPRLGTRSPGGLDLGKFGWYANRLANTCGLYAGGKDLPAPAGVYILIDSSGSMEQNLYTSPATTCGYSVALSAIEASEQTRVGIINFSSVHHVVEETRDLGRIADGITRSVGGDTLLPGNGIENFINRDGRNDIVVITDSHIRNYLTALPHFRNVLQRNPRNRGVLIVIGDDRMADDAVIRKFVWAGFQVHHHKRFDLGEVPDRRPQPRPFRFTL